MRRSRQVLLLGLAILYLLLGWQFSYAQQKPDEVDVLRVETDLIVFPIRVTDRKRNPIPNLSSADFVIRDRDGVAQSLYFSAGAERVAMVFALDESGSVRDVISQQRETALALFGRFADNSRVAVLRFAEQAKLVAGFEKDPAEARNAFAFPAGQNRRTAIFNAAQAAVSAFDSLGKVPTERRIVVLISDGLDNGSSIKPASVIVDAQEKGISFYVIHLPLFEPRDGRLSVRGPAKGFRDLATKTGGKYFLAGDSRFALGGSTVDLASIFQAIEDDLRSQYLVGFYLNERARDGRLHRLSISLKRSDLEYSVRASGFERTHHFSVNPTPRGLRAQ